MWLLSTDRAELHFFAAESNVTSQGGYAILSHVWGPNEQTFQDLNMLSAQCERTGENPRDFVCAKIRDCCILAERHGFKWVWIDTCCIDKTSSTELTEAINSMYRWYAVATVCYAYLLDVSNGDAPELVDSAFHRSRWHTRGWTLQELIAPVHVIFYSTNWQRLGDKRGLAEVLTEITGIHIDVLQGRITDLAAITVAQRMSWAAYRQTTGLEDEAYCLLGIFNITMPTLYGEGRRAFRRLQEEISKNSRPCALPAPTLSAPFSQHNLSVSNSASFLPHPSFSINPSLSYSNTTPTVLNLRSRQVA
ncbi:heterokaryon incompatibility protein-domain-containing protein [Trametes meyenii]|nr:heterokaryon incompatibility protein-domain-containing protein [Trametes meyenii]